jgi:hypothetical protein
LDWEGDFVACGPSSLGSDLRCPINGDDEEVYGGMHDEEIYGGMKCHAEDKLKG